MCTKLVGCKRLGKLEKNRKEIITALERKVWKSDFGDQIQRLWIFDWWKFEFIKNLLNFIPVYYKIKSKYESTRTLHATQNIINRRPTRPTYFITYVDEKRRITDVFCCCIGVIFGLIMFILACVLMNTGNLKKANFPTDKDGHICMLEPNSKGELRPYVYFSDLSDPMNSRYCVEDCP